MTPLKSFNDFENRLNRVLTRFRRRDNLVGLCTEMYDMERDRASGFLSSDQTAWRAKVPGEYWESSNKPQNVIDIMTAVLSGHDPQYHCTVPGDVTSTLPSRAEMFLAGVWWLNSLRQQTDVFRDITFQMVKDGACGIRTVWLPHTIREPKPTTLPHPDVSPQSIGEDEEVPSVPAKLYTQDSMPISIEAISIDKLYWTGRGIGNTPFSELFYVQQRTAADVIDEWSEQDGVNLSKVKEGVKPEDWDTVEDRYVEWWGQDTKGRVWYAIAFRDTWIISPRQINYPRIPFVIVSYKKVSSAKQALQNLPFIYPIIQAVERWEYLRSRSNRLIDMYSNMSPYHSGERPIQQQDATWGKVIEVELKEEIKLPSWTGQPPDIAREQQNLDATISEGSFSSVMFGDVSNRVSGYALSQMVGSDTLRTDTPRANLELALSAVAMLIFQLMQTFSPQVYMSVTAQVRSRKLAAILEGSETDSLVVSTFIKPKQTSDEVRLATLGSQIASMPNPPVSMRYVLEHFFGVSQPEEEIARKLDETAMKNPIITLMAMLEALKESNSPYVAIVEKQLQDAIGAMVQPNGGPSGPPQGQPGPENLPMPPKGPGGPGGEIPPEVLAAIQNAPGAGMGMQQAIMGNPPAIPPSGNPSEEVLGSLAGLIHGGPKPQP